MKTLVIHIGAHKTGTTMIQTCFDKGRRALGEKGVIYPRSNWYHHSQHRLAFSLKGLKVPGTGEDCNFDAEIDELNCEIESAPDGSKVFISSEEFFSSPLAGISRLRNRVACETVRIVAFVRSPDSLFLSVYNQNTKEPRNSFCLPISKLIENPLAINPDMHMGRCISNWASVFGHGNLSLHCYEDGSPLEVILDILGLPTDTITPSARVNESVPAVVAEVMRLSKAFSMPQHLRVDLYTLANRKYAGFPRITLSDDDRRRILQTTQQELDKLFSSFGRDNPYREDRLPSIEETPPVRPLKILVELLEELLQERGRL